MFRPNFRGLDMFYFNRVTIIDSLTYNVSFVTYQVSKVPIVCNFADYSGYATYKVGSNHLKGRITDKKWEI